LLPTITFPKFALLGLALSAPAAIAVPETEILSLTVPPLPAVSEEMLMVPVAAPLVLGVKTTLKAVLWPAPRVTGVARPLIEKPGVLDVACAIVMLAAPVLVKVSVRLAVLPTWIFPKVRVAGLGTRVAAVVIPLPNRLRTRVLVVLGWFAEYVANDMLPVRSPICGGENVSISRTLSCGLSVSGRLRLAIENPAPLNVACVMVSGVSP
jgi:hypothetical protein